MSEQRVELIRQALEAAFSPQQLEVIDESHLHVGHAGAREGKGHFRVVMVAERFGGMRPLERHRAVFAALGDLMHSDIHALGIEARAPGE